MQSLLFLPLLALSCIPEYGQNGPALPDPASGTGPCFEANLMNGIQDGAEILILFQCFNEHGAFNAVEDVVTYLCTSEDVADLVDLSNGLLGTFDLVGGLETGARLVGGDDPPVQGLLDLYMESYDRDLLRPLLGVAWETMDELVTCEFSSAPDACSIPRFGARLLETDVLDTALYILDEVSAASTTTDAVVQAENLVHLLYETSTAAGNETNQLLELGDFFLAQPRGPGSSPLERLLPYLQYFVNGDMDGDGDADPNPTNDDFLTSLAPHLAFLWREGKLQSLPYQLKYLQTYDSAGEWVGFEGYSILDELMDVLDKMGGDTSMLEQEFTIPGSSRPTTVLDLALDVVDDLYIEGADVDEIVRQLDGGFHISSRFQ